MENVEGLLGYLLRPFFIGLYIGIVGCIFFLIQGKVRARRLKKEIGRLKQHMQTKLEIEAEESERRKKELHDLRGQNENLRITLQEYMQKPGRREIRQLQVYQRAIEILTEKAPGFAQSWLSALKEGEEEARIAEKGFVPFFRKLLPGSAGSQKPLESGRKSGED
jgi:glucose-6-phosphate-specific signal transduction histidine kinase